MNYLNSYSNFLKSFLRIKRPLKVVFDCSDGTAGIILKELFQKPKAITAFGGTPPSKKIKIGGGESQKPKVSAVFINCKPDGNFPGHGPNPLAEGAMRQVEKEVIKQKADLGVIFDADGDRVFFVDNAGRSIDADKVGHILMKEFKPPVIISAISSWLLKRQATTAKAGQASGKRKIYLSRVGHYFFKKIMREKKATFGAEPSGHYYFKEFFYCDSGILTAIKIINFLFHLNIKLSTYLDSLPKYYRVPEMNFKTDNKKEIIRKIEQKYKNSASRIFKLDGLTMEFGPSLLRGRLLSKRLASQPRKSGGWWFNIRPSGTENLLRLNIEAADKKTLNQELKNLKKLIPHS